MAKKKKRRKTPRRIVVPKLVLLDGAAFLSLITAAAEVYKRECFGFLLGFRRKNRIRIKAAIAIQTADRHFRDVQISVDRYRTIERIFESLPRREVIGEFHSHPSWGNLKGTTRLSRWDLVDCDPHTIQIVIAVNDSKRWTPWRVTKKGEISGTLGDVRLNIKAYHIVLEPSGRKRGIPVPLRCRLLRPLRIQKGGPFDTSIRRERRFR
ncbi:MAG: Mov34/MPN/PAD-1 family protein [Planctomycetota bacterium]|jgi:proteasome lid subunit RPN8/RPN11